MDGMTSSLDCPHPASESAEQKLRTRLSPSKFIEYIRPAPVCIMQPGSESKITYYRGRVRGKFEYFRRICPE